MICGKRNRFWRWFLILATGAYSWGVGASSACARGPHEIRAHANHITSVLFSPDGEILASASADDKTMRLWSVRSDGRLRPLSRHTGGVGRMAFSPDGEILASPNEDGSIALWDVNTHRLTRRLSGHRSYVNAVDFSSDGRRLASVSADDTIRLWDVKSGETVNTIKIKKGRLSLSIAFSNDATMLACPLDECDIGVWSTETFARTGILKGHSMQVITIAFSADSKTLASGSGDGAIILWDSSTRKKIRSFEGNDHPASNAYDHPVLAVAFSPKGRLLAAAGGDRVIKLWNLEAGEEMASLKEGSDMIWSVHFSPDGKVLASGGGDGIIGLWNVPVE